MKQKVQDAKKIQLEGFTAYLYSEKENYPDLQCVHVDVYGRHHKCYVNDVKRIYYVIDGKGTFTLEDQVYTVEKGDVYIIEPGQVYGYEGQMQLLEVNFPAPSSDSEINLD